MALEPRQSMRDCKNAANHLAKNAKMTNITKYRDTEISYL